MTVQRQLYFTAVQDAAAMIDVRADGELLAAAWSVYGDLDADGENFRWELSFGSANAFTANDASQVIIGGGSNLGLLTSGAANTVDRGDITFPQGVALGAGERLYVHTNANGPATLVGRIWLYIEERAGMSRPSVRRR